MADMLRGGIVINEVLVDPNGALNFDTDGNGTANDTDEYVELYNTATVAIDISGLQLWDAGVGKYFTFPASTLLQPGAHALVITGVSAGGSLPSGAAGDLFFNVGRGSALINNGGDNVILYDPTANTYVAVTFNGDPLDNPTLGGSGYTGFSTTATLVGAGENFGADTDGLALQRAPDGSNTIISNTPTPGTTNVCFMNGTHLATPTGPRAVEDLAPGDLVCTLDHGAQPIRWIYAKNWSADELRLHPNTAPVLIQKNALGAGMPQRDLYVSQQHRILVRGAIARRIFGADEVLIAAKHLVALSGITIFQPANPIAYFHVMLDQHDILEAEGLPAESLYLGPQTLMSIPPSALREIEILLGKTVAQLQQALPPCARPLAQGKRARALVQRHKAHDKPLLEAV